MARNGSGGFKKILNFIGLVDQAQDYDDGESRYANGRAASSNSRPSTYVPRQQSRMEDTRRRTSAQDQRSAATSSRYAVNGARQSYNNIGEGYTVRRTGRELEDEFDQAIDTRRTEPRRVSAPQEQVSARVPAPRAAAPAGAPAVRPVGVDSCVPYTIFALEECCSVIEAVIANRMVFLTLDPNMDEHMIQRVVDTLSGATFALQATIRKGADRAYIITPRSVTMEDPRSYGRRG